jgi:hypothetical protein
MRLRGRSLEKNSGDVEISRDAIHLPTCQVVGRVFLEWLGMIVRSSFV